MWLRLAGALLLTLGALGALEYLGLSRLFGAGAPDEVKNSTQGRTREAFWFFVFTLAMATSLLAAARRLAGQLLRGRHPN